MANDPAAAKQIRAAIPILNLEGHEFDSAAQQAVHDFRKSSGAAAPDINLFPLKSYLAGLQALEVFILEFSRSSDMAQVPVTSTAPPDRKGLQIEANGGIVLSFNNATPLSFATPLGELSIGSWPGISITEDRFEGLKSQLGLVMIGPSFAESVFDGVTYWKVSRDQVGKALPDPRIVLKDARLPAQEFARLWDENRPEGREDTGASARRYRADRELFEQRGRSEPKPTAEDARTVEELRAIGTPYIKFTTDNGETWKYGKVFSYEPRRESGTLGGEIVVTENREIVIAEELGQQRIHSFMHFSRTTASPNGPVFRAATEDEVAGKAFSS